MPSVVYENAVFVTEWKACGSFCIYIFVYNGSVLVEVWCFKLVANFDFSFRFLRETMPCMQRHVAFELSTFSYKSAFVMLTWLERCFKFSTTNIHIPENSVVFLLWSSTVCHFRIDLKMWFIRFYVEMYSARRHRLFAMDEEPWANFAHFTHFAQQRRKQQFDFKGLLLVMTLKINVNKKSRWKISFDYSSTFWENNSLRSKMQLWKNTSLFVARNFIIRSVAGMVMLLRLWIFLSSCVNIIYSGFLAISKKRDPSKWNFHWLVLVCLINFM